jgi:NhaA family Na+:H+ antiporter
LGICLFSFIGVSIGLCSLPSDLKWKNIIGIGFMGGIGFTMSILIALLAFDIPAILISSKIAIIAGSIISATIGLIWLRLTLKKPMKFKNQLLN